MDSLCPWSEIPELRKQVSGIGIYEGVFELGADWSPDKHGLACDLGYVDEMAYISINSKYVQCVNMLDPTADISDFVVPGKNTICIKISTPLGNRMLADGRYIPGTIGLYSSRVIDYQNYGLTEIRMIPYWKAFHPEA